MSIYFVILSEVKNDKEGKEPQKDSLHFLYFNDLILLNFYVK